MILADRVRKATNAERRTVLLKDAVDVPNKPGVSNWVEQRGHLPRAMAAMAGDLITERGFTVSHAIATAVSRAKVLCGKGNPKYCTAVAQWERMKASTHLGKSAKPRLGTPESEVEAVLALPFEERDEILKAGYDENQVRDHLGRWASSFASTDELDRALIESSPGSDKERALLDREAELHPGGIRPASAVLGHERLRELRRVGSEHLHGAFLDSALLRQLDSDQVPGTSALMDARAILANRLSVARARNLPTPDLPGALEAVDSLIGASMRKSDS